MLVTLIIPVKNEANTIVQVLDCISLQTQPPDEIIIVDGGSTDRTVEIIKEYGRLLPIKILQIGPAFPGKGRNRGIAESSNEIVALTDAGLRLGQDWLKDLVGPFFQDAKIDVVFGGYRPLCRNNFLKAAALFVANDKDPRYNFRFPVMPSMAIKKSVYLNLGGCPEDLRATEDSVFFRRLFEHNITFAVAEDAIVEWEMEDSWRYLIRKNFHAAKYEILGGFIRKRSLILIGLYSFLLFLACASFSLSPILAILPFVLLGVRVTGSKRMDPELYDSLVSSLSGSLWLVLVTLVADLSHLSGNMFGFYAYCCNQERPKLRLWRGARFHH